MQGLENILYNNYISTGCTKNACISGFDNCQTKLGQISRNNLTAVLNLANFRNSSPNVHVIFYSYSLK